MSSLLGALSRWGYQSLEWLSGWTTLPQKVEETLSYRASWRQFLPPVHLPPKGTGRRLWIHGSSVGELEDVASFFLDPSQLARAGLRPQDVILTGASISARLPLQRWQKSQAFLYAGPLPPERSDELDDFYRILAPDLLLLSHTDIWPGLLSRAQKHLSRGILWAPARSWTHDFGWLERQCLGPVLRGIAERRLTGASSVTVVRYTDANNTPVVPIGNLRLDRVWQRIQLAKQSGDEHPLESSEAAPDPGRLSIILGSLWQDDARVWSEALEKLGPERSRRLQIVGLPHEIGDAVEAAHIRALMPAEVFRLVLLRGVLVESYRDFQMAYVGGGFRTGLHNLLEPALWGLPLLCGPQMEKQSDAPELLAAGQLRSINNAAELARLLTQWLDDPAFAETWKRQARQSQKVLESQVGATHRLADWVGQALGTKQPGADRRPELS